MTLTKLIALGMTTVLGGAGLIAAPSIIERPAAPPTFTVADGPTALSLAADPEMAVLLRRIDPSVLADPRVAEALRDPRARALLSDPAVIDAVADIDPAVLTRPGVLEMARTGELDPGLLTDPVIMANLPEIMAALPVVNAALRRAEGRASAVAVEPPAAPTMELELGTTAAPSLEAEAAPHGRRASAHAARDARRAILEARQAERRAILRDGRADEARGLTAAERSALRAISQTARVAMDALLGPSDEAPGRNR